MVFVAALIVILYPIFYSIITMINVDFNDLNDYRSDGRKHD